MGRVATRRTAVAGFVEFPTPLFVAKELLGEEIPIRIGTLSAKLRCPERQDSHSIRVSQFLGPPAPLPKAVVDNLEPPPRWGEEVSNGLYIYVVRLDTRSQVTGSKVPKEISDLQFNLRPWFESARDWIAAWTGQARLKMLIPKAAPTYGLSYDSESGPVVLGGSEPPSLVYRKGPISPASGAQVRAAMKLASRGRQVPITRALLLDSSDHLLLGDTRRSIIDVATAVEVGLANAITVYLKKRRMPRDFIDGLVSGATGVVDLVGVYADLPMPACPASKKKIADQIASPRNQAAHAGVAPPSNAVVRAIQLGREILDAVSPLPQPE